jgi:hypothetical protein
MTTDNIDIVYTPAGVTNISAPGFSGKLSQYRITGATAGASFDISSNQQEGSVSNWKGLSKVVASDDGVLEFTAPRGSLPCVISASAQ